MPFRAQDEVTECCNPGLSCDCKDAIHIVSDYKAMYMRCVQCIDIRFPVPFSIPASLIFTKPPPPPDVILFRIVLTLIFHSYFLGLAISSMFNPCEKLHFTSKGTG